MYTCRPTQQHYLNTEANSLCSSHTQAHCLAVKQSYSNIRLVRDSNPRSVAPEESKQITISPPKEINLINSVWCTRTKLEFISYSIPTDHLPCVTLTNFSRHGTYFYMPIPYSFALTIKYYIPSHGKWSMFYILHWRIEWMINYLTPSPEN